MVIKRSGKWVAECVCRGLHCCRWLRLTAQQISHCVVQRLISSGIPWWGAWNCDD